MLFRYIVLQDFRHCVLQGGEETTARNMFRVHVGRTKFVFLPYSPDRGAEGAAAVVVRDFLLNSEL